MKNLQKLKSGQRLFKQEIVEVTWGNSREKLVYLGLIGVQTVQITFAQCSCRVIENLTKTFNVFKDLNISSVPGFSF